jgi:hypothetical protein
VDDKKGINMYSSQDEHGIFLPKKEAAPQLNLTLILTAYDSFF